MELDGIARELREDSPDEWLLRWNLLECLRKLDCGPELERRLRAELLEIEERLHEEAPVAMGIDYLDRTYSRSFA